MDATPLSDREIALMAVKVEERGVQFYSAVAKKMQDSAAKEMFERLAEEEKEHRRVFLQLAEGMATDVYVFGTDEVKYVKAILGNNVFAEKVDSIEELDRIKSPQDALAFGIQAEKDAILLYHELYQNTKSDSAKKILNELLEAEKMHLVELREQMEEYQH